MRVALIPVVVCAVVFASAGLCAADDKPGRYTMTPTNGGALKLDTTTGATSFCTQTGNEWVCKPTKDGEQIMRQEMDGLKSEILVLKEQLTKMEDVAGIGEPGKNDGPRAAGKMDLPTEQDVDKAFDYVEKMVKKLRERMNKLENEPKRGAPL